MTKESTRIRREEERARKRTEILKAAVETFGTKGSANGTLADIAQQVGMTHAGVLHHFGSKENLLLEVLEYRDRTDVEGLAEKHIPGGPDLFLHLVRTAFLNAQRPGIVQVFTVLSAESVTEDHPARRYFVERYAMLRRDVHGAFRELCAQEGVTDLAAIDMAAASILAVMDGLQLQWLLDPKVIDLPAASEFAIRSIVNGVLSPAPELGAYKR
ncbi:TetR/AcrR family transcriptional regulator [Microbacterium bovistercoris]|uniref:TetR/AcrR family transcriptional regulator n=1 Tax=Microbacterium bovistercoris TaxID=2293570 RepID=A0A371NTU7_9MICO|nr:TetR/AcrR family transcriptional regulator [Microbacterium bovistercoris]REJ05691.1 TetR/AcrR family transcriptional regulator [Microbacterium bovistercoris]